MDEYLKKRAAIKRDKLKWMIKNGEGGGYPHPSTSPFMHTLYIYICRRRTQPDYCLQINV